jgi:hypothetical protein
MLRIASALVALLITAAAFADAPVCTNGRCVPRKVVVNQTIVVSAQEHADMLAKTGSFEHCGRRGGGFEGIGFSSVSPDDACRRCCFWGQRRVREIGTAWCPVRRGWVAVVRYE